MRRSLLLFAVLLAGCGSNDTADSGASAKAVEIAATDFALDPGSVKVDAAGKTTFRLVNNGATEHALEVEGPDVEEETDPIAPGESAELTVDLAAGKYALYCPIDRHRQMGMEATLLVGGDAGGTGTTEQTKTDGDSGYGG